MYAIEFTGDRFKIYNLQTLIAKFRSISLPNLLPSLRENKKVRKKK